MHKRASPAQSNISLWLSLIHTMDTPTRMPKKNENTSHTTSKKGHGRCWPTSRHRPGKKMLLAFTWHSWVLLKTLNPWKYIRACLYRIFGRVASLRSFEYLVVPNRHNFSNGTALLITRRCKAHIRIHKMHTEKGECGAWKGREIALTITSPYAVGASWLHYFEVYVYM